MPVGKPRGVCHIMPQFVQAGICVCGFLERVRKSEKETCRDSSPVRDIRLGWCHCTPTQMVPIVIARWKTDASLAAALLHQDRLLQQLALAECMHVLLQVQEPQHAWSPW